jgi:hypothetical protein
VTTFTAATPARPSSSSSPSRPRSPRRTPARALPGRLTIRTARHAARSSSSSSPGRPRSSGRTPARPPRSAPATTLRPPLFGPASTPRRSLVERCSIGPATGSYDPKNAVARIGPYSLPIFPTVRFAGRAPCPHVRPHVRLWTHPTFAATGHAATTYGVCPRMASLTELCAYPLQSHAGSVAKLSALRPARFL